MKKSFSGLLILLALNVAMITGMIGTTEYIVSFTPSADEIDSVSIVSANQYGYYTDEEILYYSNNDIKSYFGNLESKLEITDKNIKELVANALYEKKEDFDEDGFFWEFSSYTNSSTKPIVETEKYIVKIKKGLREEYRTLDLPIRVLKDYLKENEGYTKIYTDLPEYNKKYISLEFEGSVAQMGTLSEESLIEIYDTYRGYLKEKGFDTAYKLLAKSNNATSDKLKVSVNKNGTKGYFYIPLEAEVYSSLTKIDFMPIYSLYAELYNKENQASKEKVFELFARSSLYTRINIAGLGNEDLVLYLSELSNEKIAQLKGTLIELDAQNSQDYSKFIRIQVTDHFNTSSGTYDTYVCYIPFKLENLPPVLVDFFGESLLGTEKAMFIDGDIYSSPSNAPIEIVKYSMKCTALGLTDYAREYFAEDFDYSNLNFSVKETYYALYASDYDAAENGYYGLDYTAHNYNRIIEVKRRKHLNDATYSTEDPYVPNESYYFLLTRDFVTEPWRITDYVYCNY